MVPDHFTSSNIQVLYIKLKPWPRGTRRNFTWPLANVLLGHWPTFYLATGDGGDGGDCGDCNSDDHDDDGGDGGDVMVMAIMMMVVTQ